MNMLIIFLMESIEVNYYYIILHVLDVSVVSCFRSAHKNTGHSLPEASERSHAKSCTFNSCGSLFLQANLHLRALVSHVTPSVRFTVT